LKDFGAIQAENHLDDIIEIDDHIYEDFDDDNRSQASLSLLSEKDMQVQKMLYRKKAIERRRQGGAYSIGSKTGCLASNRNIDIAVQDDSYDLRSQSAMSESLRLDSFRDNSIGCRDEEAESDDVRNSINVDQNASIISDMDSSMVDTPDYGILHQYRFKSIESTVPDFYEHLTQVTDFSLPHHQAFNDTVAFFDAATPKVQNNGPSSIASYMDDLYLPSVSIDNAETGLVTWRKFPKTDLKAKTARKLDFYGSVENNNNDVQDQASQRKFPSDSGGLRNKCATDTSDQPYHQFGDATRLTKEQELAKPSKIKVRSILNAPIYGC
jgi:hypothetical protein